MNKEIIQDVRQAEAARLLAMRRNNAEVLSGLLADDLTYLHSGGEKDTKASYLATIRNGKLIYPPDLAIEISAIEIVQDEVHVRAKMTGTVIVNGLERHLNTTPLTVWKNPSGPWQLVRFEAKPSPH